MAKKEFLTMADAFPDGAPGLPAYWSDEEVKHAAHAINAHDELVAENERLRDMVCRMGLYLEMSGEHPEKESYNPIRQWLFDAIEFMDKDGAA